MKRIILIRHGQSTHNEKNNSLSGISDVELTDEGREQCKRLSQRFSSQTIDHVYSSPLSRAKETAMLIFPYRTISIRDSLIELNYGSYEGFDRSKMTRPDPIIDQWNCAPADVKFPKGDHVKMHGHYVYGELVKLVEETDFETIACVSHRTTIRLIVSQVIGLPLNRFRSIPCSNCSITELSFTDQLELESLNVPLKCMTLP